MEKLEKTIKPNFTRALAATFLACAPFATLAANPTDLDALPVSPTCRLQSLAIAKVIDQRDKGLARSTVLKQNRLLSGPDALPPELIEGAFRFRQLNSAAMQSYVMWSCHALSNHFPPAPLAEVGVELAECFNKPARQPCERELRNEVVGLPRGYIPGAQRMQPVTSGMKPQAVAAAGVTKSPVAGSCADPVYPVASLRNQEDGTVTLEFKIDATGSVVAGNVATKSGFNRLDEAALAALRLCTYRPDMVDGKPVGGLARVVWKWALD